jgi:hypothetical protein
MQAPRKNFVALTQLYPPVLCRLLARHRYGPPLSEAEIAIRAKMTIREVQALSQLTTWDSCDLSTVIAFSAACGVDFCNWRAMKRIDAYLKSGPTWRYLRASRQFSAKFEPLLRIYRNRLRSQIHDASDRSN